MINAARQEQLTVQLVTGHQARLALGAALRLLSAGYEFAATLQDAGGTREAAIRWLDSSRGYCETVFNSVPASDELLSDDLRRRAGFALASCEDTVDQIRAVTGGGWAADFEASVGEALRTGASTVGEVIAGGAASLLSNASGTLWSLLAPMWWLIALGVAVFLWQRRAQA